MIVDREEEIRAFKPEEYWSLDAKFIAPSSKRAFAAAFVGDETGKVKITDGDQANEILARLEGASYAVTSVKKAPAANSPRRRLPPPPYSRRALANSASRANAR